MIRFLVEARDFHILHNVQIDSGAHPTSYKMGTWSCFPAETRQVREADHLPSSSAEVKNGEWRSFISTPLYVFMAWCLINKAQE
jgi:hypothetical protein